MFLRAGQPDPLPLSPYHFPCMCPHFSSVSSPPRRQRSCQAPSPLLFPVRDHFGLKKNPGRRPSLYRVHLSSPDDRSASPIVGFRSKRRPLNTPPRRWVPLALTLPGGSTTQHWCSPRWLCNASTAFAVGRANSVRQWVEGRPGSVSQLFFFWIDLITGKSVKLWKNVENKIKIHKNMK
jgi:hypothetical protein